MKQLAKQRSRQVLLVVHDQVCAQLARHGLEAASDRFTLEVAENLAAACAAIAQTTPDVLILDSQLPDGEITEFMGRADPGHACPILLLIGQDEDVANLTATRAGVLGVVAKTAESLLDLPRTISQTLREWELLQQQREMQQLLRQRELHYHNLLEAIPDLILIILSDGLLLGSCGWRHGFGTLHSEALIGKHLSEFVSPEVFEDLQQVIADVLENDRPNIVEFDLRLDGETYHVEAHLTAFDTQSVIALLRNTTERKAATALLDRLTHREREVLQGVVLGKPNKVIAQELGIVIKTVEAHRGKLLKKLRARSTAELVRVALAAQRKI